LAIPIDFKGIHSCNLLI